MSKPRLAVTEQGHMVPWPWSLAHVSFLGLHYLRDSTMRNTPGRTLQQSLAPGVLRRSR